MSGEGKKTTGVRGYCRSRVENGKWQRAGGGKRFYAFPAVLISFFAAVVFPLAGTAEPGPPSSMESEETVVSTTIDFLDYVFYHTDPEAGYYTLEQYEEVISSLAEAGIRKVYLRVDVCGLTLYPTNVGKQYAGDGREPWSTWLVNTLRRYDPAAETIRLCREYGLEPWAWDTLFDDEASVLNYAPGSELARLYGERPLKDPFLSENPHFQWRLDPRRAREIERQREACSGSGPVERLRITSDIARSNRVEADDFDIFVSDDNRNWRKLDRDWSLRLESNRPPVLVIEGLSVDRQYIKLAWVSPRSEEGWTVAGERGWNFVEGWWDGAWHPLLSDWREQREDPGSGSFQFITDGARFAWDYRDRALGLARSPVELPEYTAMAEFAWPEVRRYKQARLDELSAYDFDGFSYSLRTHSYGSERDNYGFGEPVREAFLERYGVDIWEEDFDRSAWLELRAEFVEKFLREAAESLSPRPLFVDWITGGYERHYGGLPFRPEHWADESGGVAGIRFVGFSPDRPLPYNPGGMEGVKRVRFVDNHPWPVAADLFRGRLRRWLAEPGTDEIEYYETMLYTPGNPEYMRIFREEIERAGGEGSR